MNNSYAKSNRLWLLLLLVLLASCKKDDDKSFCDSVNSQKGKPSGGGGIGLGSSANVYKEVMFWVKQDFACGELTVTRIKNKQIESTDFSGNKILSKYFSGEPPCGTTGAATISVIKGYSYEYTIACPGRSWQGEFTADCENTCLIIEVK